MSNSNVIQLEAQLNIEQPDYDNAVITANLGVKDGENGVTVYHEKMFDKHNGGEINRLERQRDTLQDDVNITKKQLIRKNKELEKTDETLLSEEEAVRPPWSGFDVATFTLFGMVSLVLLFVSFSAVFTNLMATGEAFFIENEWAVYLFSSIPLALTFGLKAVDGIIESDQSTRRYIGFLLSIGLFSGIIWIILFALVYSGTTQSTADIVNEMFAEQEGWFERQKGTIFFVSQVLSEVTISAAFWLLMKKMYDSHYQVPPRDNPVYLRYKQDVEHLKVALDESEEKLSKAICLLEQISNKRKVYISDAISEFQIRNRHYLQESKVLMIPSKSTKGRVKNA